MKQQSPILSTLRYATTANNEALETEKAYILNYDAPPDIPKSNFIIDFYPNIPIHDLRTSNLNFRENGVTISQLAEHGMLQQDFQDEGKVEKDYLPAVHQCIMETLGAEKVYIFDYMIRRREPEFPHQPKWKDTAPQPALSAHIGA